MTACLTSALRSFGPAGSLYSFLVVAGPSSAAQQLNSRAPPGTLQPRHRSPPISPSSILHTQHLHQPLTAHGHSAGMAAFRSYHTYNTFNQQHSVLPCDAIRASRRGSANIQLVLQPLNSLHSISSSSLISGPSYLQALDPQPPEFLAVFFLFSVSSVPVQQ